MRSRLIFWVITGLMMGAVLLPAQAQVSGVRPADCTELGIPCVGTANDPGGALNIRIRTILLAGLSFIGILALIILIYGGVRYIAARGDEREAAVAKNIILYTVIGLLVVGLAAAAVQFVVNTLQAPPAGRP